MRYALSAPATWLSYGAPTPWETEEWTILVLAELGARAMEMVRHGPAPAPSHHECYPSGSGLYAATNIIKFEGCYHGTSDSACWSKVRFRRT